MSKKAKKPGKKKKTTSEEAPIKKINSNLASLAEAQEALALDISKNTGNIQTLAEAQEATILLAGENERQLQELAKKQATYVTQKQTSQFATQKQAAGLPQHEDYKGLSQRVKTLEEKPATVYEKPTQVPKDKPDEAKEKKLSQAIEDAEKAIDNKCEIAYRGLDKAEQRVEALEPRTRELKKLVESTIPNYLEKKVDEVEKAAGAAQEAQEQLEKQAEKYQRELRKFVRQAKDASWGSYFGLRKTALAGAALAAILVGLGKYGCQPKIKAEHGYAFDEDNIPNDYALWTKSILGKEKPYGGQFDNGDFERGDRINKLILSQVQEVRAKKVTRKYHARRR